MKKVLLFQLLIIVAIAGTFAQQMHDSVYTKVGFAASIDSEMLKETRKLFIHLPVDFDRVFDPDNLFQSVDGKDIKFFMSLGGDELVGESMKSFALKLESEAPESLKWKLTVKEEKNHDSNAIVGYMDGLEFVFEQ